MNRSFLFYLFIFIFLSNSQLSCAEISIKDLFISNSSGEIKVFTVEIADNDITRSIGFMGREKIPQDTGMLFVWEDEAYRNFWMKNTPTSLDVIFFDSNGKFLRDMIF